MAEKEVKVVISGDSSGAEAAMKKTSGSARDLASAVDKAGSSKGLDELNAKAKKATTGIGGLSGALDALKGAAALGVIGGIVTQITNMGTSAVMAAAKMKQYEIAFSTMLKSAEQGKAMMQDLQDFAAKTPFDVPGVVEAAQQLTAFGFEAKEIIPTLTTLGDAAAGLGRGSEGVKLMGYALGQIKAAGTLKTQDVNQLVNAGVSVWQMLADASGKSVAEIKEMTENSMIDSAAAIAVITDGMKNSYGGMMEATGKEMIGLINEVEEGIGNLAAFIGGYVTDAFGLKDIMASIAESLGDVSTSFRVAKEAGASFGEALVKAVPAPLLVTLGTLVTLIGGALVAAAGAAATAIGAVLTPVAGVIAAVTAVGAGISLLVTTSETARNAISATFGAIKSAIQTVMDIVHDLTGIFTDSSKTFGDSYLEAVGYVIGLFYRLGDNIWDAMGNAKDAVFDFVGKSIDSIMEFLTAGASSGDDFVDIMGNMAKNAVKSIGEWFESLPSKLASVFNSMKAGFSLSADGAGLGIKGWMSSGSSDDYDKTSEDFNPYTGEKSSKINKGSFNLSGSGGATKSSRGRSRGSGGLDKTKREISRINEALAKAADATDALKSKFADLQLDVAVEGVDGSDKVFAQIEKEKTARLRAVDETLKAQLNAVKEAAKLRESAEKTGDASAIAGAQDLYNERNTLYQNSLNSASAMRAEIEQQAADKSLTMETALLAAKANLDAAAKEIDMENYLAYLDSKDAELYSRLMAEQEYKQQLMEWEMESQQTLLDFAFQAAETMKNQLASGIAAVVTEGKSFGAVLKGLGKQILNMFVQWIVGRQLAAMMEKLMGKAALAETKALAQETAAAWEPAAALAEAAAPGSIARGQLAAAAVGASGAASSALNISSGSDGSGGLGGASFMNGGLSSALGGTGASSTSYAGMSGAFGASGGGLINITTNNYGAINNGWDANQLMGGLNDSILGAIRSG